MRHPILNHISYHAAYDDSAIDALEYAEANGFSGIQLAVESPHLSLDNLSGEEIDKISSSAQSSGTYVVLHGPDEVASLYQGNSYLWPGVAGFYRSLFNCAAKLRSPLVTIHAGTPITFATDSLPEKSVPDQDLPLYKAVFESNLNELLKMADRRFTLCVENHNLDGLTRILLQPYLDSRSLALCWDIPKSWHKPEVERFFMDNLDRVKQVHIHDSRPGQGGVYQRHRVIGTGEIDFKPYLELLRNVEVIDYCLEVRPREKALESLAALKRLVSQPKPS